jgi:hypothetical protein
VDDCDGPCDVRVRVDLRRAAVCRPSSVSNANRTREVLLEQCLFEVSKLSDGSDNLDSVLPVYG